jgi:hypothetical protein
LHGTIVDFRETSPAKCTTLGGMVTRTQFAMLALAMPEAVQGSHFGQPDFRVRGKIFAGLDRAAERASLEVRKDLQALLVDSRPEAFVPAAGAWGDHGWTYAELPRVSLDELRDWVADAWRQIAPAQLVAQHAGVPDDLPELDITVSVKPRARKRPAPSRKTLAQKPSSKKRPAKKPTKRKATRRKVAQRKSTKAILTS